MSTPGWIMILFVFAIIFSCFNITIVTTHKKCVDNVEYIVSGYGITVAYDVNGKIKTCNAIMDYAGEG